MATIRAFTTIEQSRKLAEILPLESADMKILPFTEREYRIVPINDIAVCGREDELYAWSLAALLGVLPNIIGDCFKTINCLYGWHCAYMNGNGEIIDNDTEADNPVDACVAMIEKLHELNLL